MTISKEVCDLARTLMGSTCTHVASHIAKEKYRHAYVRAVARCYHMCSEAENGNDLVLMRNKLNTLRCTVPKHLKRRWFGSENGYYIMGIQHSINIADSILTRFVRGYSSEDEVFVRNILEHGQKELQTQDV